MGAGGTIWEFGCIFSFWESWYCGVVGGVGDWLNMNDVLMHNSLWNLFFLFQNARGPLITAISTPSEITF